jgi:hypothetical protein
MAQPGPIASDNRAGRTPVSFLSPGSIRIHPGPHLRHPFAGAKREPDESVDRFSVAPQIVQTDPFDARRVKQG